MVHLTRPRRAITGFAALFVMLLVSALPGVAHGDPVQDKKAQAAAIAAKIEELANVVGQYAEAANGAEIELAGLNAQVAAAQAKVAESEALLQRHKSDLRTYAVDAYIKGSDDLQAEDLGSFSASDLGQAQGYLSAAAGNRQQLIDQLRAIEQDVQAQIAQLNVAQGEAQAKANDLNSKRSAAANAVAQQQALKNQVDAELNRLVAAEQARRDAAAAAQASQRRAAASSRQPVAAPSGPISSSGGAGTAVSVALAQVGKPYQWGGSGPDSFDCSGLMMYAWGAAGVRLAHYVPTQYSQTRHVTLDQIQPGDIIYYNGFGHNGMYIGGGQIVHAPRTGKFVEVVDLYWVGNPIAASRP